MRDFEDVFGIDDWISCRTLGEWLDGVKMNLFSPIRWMKRAWPNVVQASFAGYAKPDWASYTYSVKPPRSMMALLEKRNLTETLCLA
jgi:hypothetical protein